MPAFSAYKTFQPGLRTHAAQLACLLSLASSSVLAQETPPAVTLGAQQPLAIPLLQDDATAMNGNPAMLGFSGGLHLDLTSQSNAYGNQQAGGLYASLGSSSHAELGFTVGFAAEYVQPTSNCDLMHPCDRRLTYGLATRAQWLSLGAQVHTFASNQSAALDGLASVDAGAAIRPSECLALGFSAFDINRPSLNGNELPLRYQASLAVRPLCSRRLTLEVDGNAVSCGGTPAFELSGTPRACGISNTDVRGSVEFAIFDGIRLLAAVQRTAGDERVIAEMGLALDFGHLGLRVAGTGAHGYGYLSSTVHLSSEAYDRPAFVEAIEDRAVELNLSQALERKRPTLAEVLFDAQPPDPLTRTLTTLRRLGRDRHVHAIVLTANGLQTSLAGAEELRSEIGALRAAGKRVLFFLENGGDLEYYVAVSADRVFATPQALLELNGFSATVFFAGAGLDKLGVKAEFFRVGAYKNAPDLFTRSDMSAEQREVETSMLGDMASRYARAVVESRGSHGGPGFGEMEFRALLDKGILAPEEAVSAGLVDGLVYRDQLAAEVGKLDGKLAGRVKLRAVTTDPPVGRETRWGGRDKIVLVRVEGAITMEGEKGSLFSGAVAGARNLAQTIRKAADDSDVAAIVVRVDSPGGDGNASDVIWRELVRARKEKGKPVVVSMGEYAASGGYYVAAAGDAIWAEPSTITGSIGVFAGHFDASELFGKLGISTATVKTNESADLESPTRLLTPRERARFQSLVDMFYKTFVTKVAEGRHMSFDAVDQIARGRVWTGAQAKERGLVDHLGGLEDAIADAKSRAGIPQGDDIDLVDDRNRGDGGEAGRSMQAALHLFGLDGISAVFGWTGLEGMPLQLDKALQALDALGAPGTVRARLPYQLDIH